MFQVKFNAELYVLPFFRHCCLSVRVCCLFVTGIIKAIIGLQCLKTFHCNSISNLMLDTALEVLESNKNRSLYISGNSAGMDYDEFMSRHEGVRIDKHNHRFVYKQLAWFS